MKVIMIIPLLVVKTMKCPLGVLYEPILVLIHDEESNKYVVSVSSSESRGSPALQNDAIMSVACIITVAMIN